jgi:hypothetical protein
MEQNKHLMFDPSITAETHPFIGDWPKLKQIYETIWSAHWHWVLSGDKVKLTAQAKH